MNIIVTRRYIHTFVPPRCRAARQEAREIEVSVCVREVSGDDAPVAILTKKGSLLSCETPHYRWWNNFLWTPVGKKATLNNVTTYLTGSNYRTFQSQEEAEDCTHDSAVGILMVDEQLYELTSEPVLQVRTFGVGGNHGGTSVAVSGCDDALARVGNAYNLLEVDLAIKAGLATAKERGDSNSYQKIKSMAKAFEVLIPEAIKFDGASVEIERLESRAGHLQKEIDVRQKEIDKIRDQIIKIKAERQ